jgi:hypothetical protein
MVLVLVGIVIVRIKRVMEGMGMEEELVLVLLDRIEDGADGTEDVELDYCAPEDTFRAECGGGVEALEFWLSG